MVSPSSQQTPQITADEVLYAMQSHKDIVILDVRTAGEFSRGKIEGSMNVSVDEIAERIESIIPDKKTIIYAYCLSGARSDAAVAELIAKGYVNAFSMTNGLLMWRSKQYPMVP